MSENLPETINYQDYQIRPTPMKVIVEGAERWNTRFEIRQDKRKEVTIFPFYGRYICELKEDAVKHCFREGKHIIDNEPEKLVKNNDT